MNVLRASCRVLCKSRSQFRYWPSTRGAIYLDMDWMPGPYPKTEAERLAAAKKYNLLPVEYQAYDPEKWEFAYGDYPQLPNICYSDLDPYQTWDYMCLRKDYGAVWHVNTDIYGLVGVDLHYEYDIPFREVIYVYILAIGFVVLWNYIFEIRYERITVYKPMHRVYPGETYYHYPNSDLSKY